MWSIPTVKYYSAIKRNAVLTPATTWMNPENTVSRRRPDTKAHLAYNSIHTKHPEQAATPRQQEGRLPAAGRVQNGQGQSRVQGFSSGDEKFWN